VNSSTTTPASTVRYGLRAVGVVQDGHGVEVSFADDDDSPCVIRAQYAVGADGGRSTIRQALGVDAPTLRQLRRPA